MAYELAIALKDGWIEIEADTPAQLEKRIAALDIAALERAVRQARGKKAAKKPRASTKRRR